MGFALLVGASAAGPIAHADDHGDSLATATRVELPSETAGIIDPGDDMDWFRFDVATRGEVTAETTGDLDTVGTLYDADGNELATNDDSATRNFHILRALDAGAYYVRVTSFGSGTGSYVLRLRVRAETAPTVSGVAITSRPVSGDTYELGEAIEVQVAFDRAVDVTGTWPQLALTIGATTRQARSYYLSDGTFSFSYRMQSSDLDKDGISIGANALTLNDGTIRFRGGTTGATLSLGSHAIANSANHKVDGSRETAPAVTRVSIWSDPANGDIYELGERVRVSVFFDRPVDATGQPELALTIGAARRQVSLVSPAFGSTSLTFRYTVHSSDLDSDGISIGANALTLNGGAIKLSGGNADASLNLRGHAISNAADHKVDGSLETAPAVGTGPYEVYLSPPTSGDTFEFGEVIIARVSFDRAVEVDGEP